jgi:hypothetical protein
LSTRPTDVTLGATGPTNVYDNGRGFWVVFAGTVVMNVVVVLSTAFAIAAVMYLVADTYLDAPMTNRRSAQIALRRLPAVLWLAIVTSVLTVAGMFLCLLPGIWLWVAWSVAVPALLLEGKGVGKALSRSMELTRRRFWTCFAVRLVSTILTTGVAWALTVSILGAVHVAVHGTAAIAIAQGVAGAITSALTVPFAAAAIIVLYFDLRVRAEGFDIQIALQRLDTARANASANATATAAATGISAV